jgi:5-(carboxyamino)imidazole ribonucleotide mutase
MKYKVAIVMGSKNDYPVVQKAEEALSRFGISFETKVLSAHRTPLETREFAVTAREAGFCCIIAAAGKAAHLAGSIAAAATLPVIGIPIAGSAFGGLDALLSTVQMPAGVPVAAVAVDGAENAGILAAEIIGAFDMEIGAKLALYREKLKEAVLT